MSDTELLISALLAAVVGLTALSLRLSVPYPIVLVVGGGLLGFVPGLPEVTLQPEVVLLVFLPPLLYGESIFANVGDFRSNLRGLALATVGLVLLTMTVVAALAHLVVPDLPWAAAFVLGAVVSPTDALAPGQILRRLGVPRRIVSVVEGEGLFNDATALVAYRVAVVAVVSGSFSLARAGLMFLLAAAGGVAIGLAVGWISARIRQRTGDTQLDVTISLLTGYAAYVPADALGASGVLAAVTAGIYMGIRGPGVLDVRSRLQGSFVWEVVDFVLNAVLFVLVGLQLHSAIDGLAGSGYGIGHLLGYAVAVIAGVVVTRVVWLFTMPYLFRLIDRRPSQRARRLPARHRLVMAWSGMRGSISLAVALALPTRTESGQPFPHRNLILFLVFAVIFATLVLQGLTLPVLVRRLHVDGSDGPDGAAGDDGREEIHARLVATKAALQRIDDLEGEDWTRPETVDRMRGLYEYRKRRFAARAGKIEDDGYEDRSLAYQRMVQSVLAAQRDALIRLRSAGELSTEAMNRILRELDLEESRLEL